MLKIDFGIESREYTSKRYSDIKAWKIEEKGASIQNNSDAIPYINFVESQSNDDILTF